jgi:hypothetical protein
MEFGRGNDSSAPSGREPKMEHQGCPYEWCRMPRAGAAGFEPS